MKTRLGLYNTVIGFLLQVITLISGFLLPRLFILNYGSAVNGLRASITLIVGNLSIFEVGLGGALVFALYNPIANSDVILINKILALAQKNYRKVGFLLLFCILVIGVIFSSTVSIKDVNSLSVFILVFSLGATGVINFFWNSVYIAYLSALQRSYIHSLIRIIYVILNIGIIYLCVYNNLDIGLTFFFSILANIIQTLILHSYIKLKYPKIKLNTPSAEGVLLQKRYDVVIHQISGLVVTSTPVVLLTLFSGLETVSVYSVYALIFTGLSMLIGVIGNGFSAAFGDSIAKGDRVSLKSAYSRFELIFYIIVTFLYSTTLIMGPSFIRIYTKGATDVEYYNVVTLLLFCLVGILTSWKVPQSIVIVSAGHFKETRKRAVLEVLVTLTFSVPLVILFGLNGVLIGTALGLMTRSLDIVYAKNISGQALLTTLKRIARLMLLVILAYFVQNLGLLPFVDEFSEWILQSIFVSLIVVIITFIVNTIFDYEDMIKSFRSIKLVLIGNGS